MFVTAFLLGIGGSLHCFGMCSPLAAAIANRTKHTSTLWLYQLGRIFTYALLGSLVASMGYLLPLQSVQNVLTISIGCVFISIGILGVHWLRIPKVHQVLTKITIPIKTLFAAQIQRKSPISALVLGAINGLLPCGLTLAALTACIVLPSPAEGFLFMAMFGLGTLPAMLAAKSIQWFVNRQWGLSYRTLNSILLIAAGALLVGRAFHSQHNHTFATSETAPICRE